MYHTGHGNIRKWIKNYYDYWENEQEHRIQISSSISRRLLLGRTWLKLIIFSSPFLAISPANNRHEKQTETKNCSVHQMRSDAFDVSLWHPVHRERLVDRQENGLTFPPPFTNTQTPTICIPRVNYLIGFWATRLMAIVVFQQSVICFSSPLLTVKGFSMSLLLWLGSLKIGLFVATVWFD